jgi:glutamate transport system substrate-binding protein
MRVRRTAPRAVALAAATVVTLGLAACGSTDELDSKGGSGSGTNESYQLKAADTLPGSVQKIKDKGRLVVGTKYDQPGFGLQNPTNQKIEGFDAEIARLIAIRIFGSADKVEFQESKSAVREQVIQNGTVDIVVATYTINDDRKTKIDFAGPYFEAGQDILVKSDNDSIRSVDDLNGKKVCTQTGSTSIDNVKQAAPQANVTALDSYALCADGVRDGTYDAVSTDNVILLGLASKSDGALKLVNKPFSKEPYGIGLKKGDDELRGFINDTLEEIHSNGDWKRAWDKTVGSFLGAAPTPPAVDRY